MSHNSFFIILENSKSTDILLLSLCRHSRSPKERKRSRSPEKNKEKRHEDPKRSKDRRRKSPSPRRPFRRGRTPPNSASRRYDRSDDDTELEERDARTIFCMQLSQRVRARDLEEFFSSVGKVRDVRLITCNKTKRFKGIAYIEFKSSESVALVCANMIFVVVDDELCSNFLSPNRPWDYLARNYLVFRYPFNKPKPKRIAWQISRHRRLHRKIQSAQCDSTLAHCIST